MKKLYRCLLATTTVFYHATARESGLSNHNAREMGFLQTVVNSLNSHIQSAE